jgi:hypothetical protein
LVLRGSLPPTVGHHERLEAGTQTSFDERSVPLLSSRLRPLVPTHECRWHFRCFRAAMKPDGPALTPLSDAPFGGACRHVAGRSDPLKDRETKS